jgi:hypothetical protein
VAIVRAVLDASGCDLEPEDLLNGSVYYANSFVRRFFGRIGIAVETPDVGIVDIQAVIGTVWLDGFQHGAATTAGLTSVSEQEKTGG